MSLYDEVLYMVHAFSDQERKDAVRNLANRVAELESDKDCMYANALEFQTKFDLLKTQNEELKEQLDQMEGDKADLKLIIMRLKSHAEAMVAYLKSEYLDASDVVEDYWKDFPK